MSKRYEGHLSGFDQTELFFQTWAPERTRGVVLITHGLGEHGERYDALAERLTEDGWQTYAWDLRGHGKSDGKRGYVRHVDDFGKDLALVHRMIRERHPGFPVVLFGHSLGGLITLRFVETEHPVHAALVLSSPALGLTQNVPKFKAAIAEVANKWLPTLTLGNEIDPRHISRDPAVIKAYSTDNLVHDRISPGLFLSMVESFAPALDEADRVKGPVLMLLAGDDHIARTESARAVFARFPNEANEIHIYPDSQHEVFNDLDRQSAIEHLTGFINGYLGQ